jgi:hypothetical protein
LQPNKTAATATIALTMVPEQHSKSSRAEVKSIVGGGRGIDAA